MKKFYLNVKKMISNKLSEFSRNITDDKYRFTVQFEIITLILSAVSFFMFILNIITSKTYLTIATGCFSALCLIIFFLAYKRKTKLTVTIFILAVIVLFTYFLIFGGTEGFSPLWILILPSCSMLLFGIKIGSFASAMMFVLTAAFLWTPLNKIVLQYDYTTSFMMRFPLVYIACFVIGLFFEYVRMETNKKLVESSAKINELAKTDALTGMKNRMAFNMEISKKFEEAGTSENLSVMIMDIDYFKFFNDTFGHLEGDRILKTVAETIFNIVSPYSDMFYRWGGEEFICLVENQNDVTVRELSKKICEGVESLNISNPSAATKKITLSVGYHFSKEALTFAALQEGIISADKALYKAKSNGKNRFYSSAE